MPCFTCCATTYLSAAVNQLGRQLCLVLYFSIFIVFSIDVNARDQDGCTPLHNAASWNDNPDMIARLVELGADIDVTTPRGKTARDLLQDNEKLGHAEKIKLSRLT